MVIDTHCHLDKDDYENLDEIINNMKDNLMIASGVDLKTSLNVIELCNIEIFNILKLIFYIIYINLLSHSAFRLSHQCSRILLMKDSLSELSHSLHIKLLSVSFCS